MSKSKLPEIDGIIVHCEHSEIVPVEKIKPYPRNNKIHPPEQIAMLAKAIKAQGWRTAITVSIQSGYIVRGHARLEAAKSLGLSAVPVDYQHYADGDAERLDRIADNKIAELAEWDMPALKEELLELDTGALDMELSGFSDAEVEKMMTAPLGQPDIPALELQPFEHYDYVVVLCENTLDWEWLCEKLGIERVNGSPIQGKYKIGLGRAVKCDRLISLLKITDTE